MFVGCSGTRPWCWCWCRYHCRRRVFVVVVSRIIMNRSLLPSSTLPYCLSSKVALKVKPRISPNITSHIPILPLPMPMPMPLSMPSPSPYLYPRPNQNIPPTRRCRRCKSHLKPHPPSSPFSSDPTGHPSPQRISSGNTQTVDTHETIHKHTKPVHKSG